MSKNIDNLNTQNSLLKEQLDLLKQEENAFSSISGIISGNLADLGKTNDARSVAISNARKLRSISDKLLANETSSEKLSAKQLKTLEDQSEVATKILNDKIKSASSSKDEIKSLKDIVKFGKLQVKLAEEKRLEAEKQEQSGGILLNTLKGAESLLRKSGFGSLSDKLKLKETLKSSGSISSKFKTIGTNLTGAISKADVLSVIFSQVVKAAKRADTNIANLRRNFGLSFNEGRKLNDQFASIAMSTSDVTANVESLTEANQNINNELGIQTVYNDDLLITANSLVKRNKLSAEAAAGFSKQVLSTGINAENLLDISAETVASIQNQSGVQLSFNSVLEGANKISGQLRANLMRTPDGLVKAVATAKTLGVEMSDIAGIAGQLLDFESSIEKELQAELMIGRDLNLERARSLALQGKSDEAVASMVEQFGTLADFQNMNVLAQQSLAGAVGMTADQLATSLEKQSAINASKKEGLSIDAESMKEGAKAQSVQEKLASAVEKLNSVLQATLFIVGGILAMAAIALAIPTAGLSLTAMAGIGAVLGGVGSQLVSDGIAPASKGPFTITDSFGATAITAKGDGVAVSPNINQGSSNNDSRETNALLRQILNKEGTVKMDSTDVGTAFAMNTYQVQ